MIAARGAIRAGDLHAFQGRRGNVLQALRRGTERAAAKAFDDTLKRIAARPPRSSTSRRSGMEDRSDEKSRLAAWLSGARRPVSARAVGKAAGSSLAAALARPSEARGMKARRTEPHPLEQAPPPQGRAIGAGGVQKASKA
jgi:hypothetical protein